MTTQLPQPGTEAGPATEDPALCYQRQTRNATVFIAVVVGTFAVFAMISMVVGIIQIVHALDALNGTTNGSCVPGVTC